MAKTPRSNLAPSEWRMLAGLQRLGGRYEAPKARSEFWNDLMQHIPNPHRHTDSAFRQALIHLEKRELIIREMQFLPNMNERLIPRQGGQTISIEMVDVGMEIPKEYLAEVRREVLSGHIPKISTRGISRMKQLNAVRNKEVVVEAVSDNIEPLRDSMGPVGDMVPVDEPLFPIADIRLLADSLLERVLEVMKNPPVVEKVVRDVKVVHEPAPPPEVIEKVVPCDHEAELEQGRKVLERLNGTISELNQKIRGLENSNRSLKERLQQKTEGVNGLTTRLRDVAPDVWAQLQRTAPETAKDNR